MKPEGQRIEGGGVRACAEGINETSARYTIHFARAGVIAQIVRALALRADQTLSSHTNLVSNRACCFVQTNQA